jgi:hypothetical protein
MALTSSLPIRRGVTLVASAIIRNAIHVFSAAQHCGQRDHLNDDLHIVTLSQELIASPPAELWPKVIRRLSVPADVEEVPLNKLDQNQ